LKILILFDLSTGLICESVAKNIVVQHPDSHLIIIIVEAAITIVEWKIFLSENGKDI
jgi:hypothetical protein